MLRPPLPIVAELAPGVDPGGSPADWEFTSDGVRWRTKVDIAITQGRDDEDSETTAGSLDITFDDRSGKLSPRNVLGEWYGEIGRNTPIRLMLDAMNDQFSRTLPAGGWGTDPSSGREWGHSATSAWSVDGSYGVCSRTTFNTAAYALARGSVGADVDITHVSRLDSMPVGGAWIDATVVRYLSTTNHYRLHTEFQPDGTIQVKIIRVLAGVPSDLVSLTATGVPFTAGQEIATHVRVVGAAMQIRCWRVGVDDEPTTWHATARDTSIMGTAVGLYEWRLNTSGPTAIRIDSFQVRSNLYGGMVPEWPVRWPSKSGVDSITPVTASGVLRWLEQNTPPARSAIDMQLSGKSGAAYWRLEDAAGATSGASAIARGSVATVVDATFGNDDAPPGAISALELNSAGSSRVTGNVNSWPFSQNGYQLLVFARFPTMPAASPAVSFIELRGVGKVTRWVITCDAATFNMTGYDADGDLVTTTGGVLYGGVDPTKWFAFRIKVSEVGPAVNYDMSWHQVGSTVFWGLNGSYVGSGDRPLNASVIAPVDGTLVDHLWIGSRDAVIDTDEFKLTAAGYAGETDVERIARVFADIGVDVIIHPGEGTPLGAQPKAATAVEVARDAEAAGLGVLYEHGFVPAYLPRDARMNTPVALELDWALGHLAEQPEPADDDLDVCNRFEARRPNGSSRIADDPDHIARNRMYADGEEFNTQTDDQLSDVASMKVAEGTTDALRWPRIVIDLVAHPELIPSWLGCRVGSRVTIDNLPIEQLAGEIADLVIEGYTQTINKHVWRVELTLSPIGPWGAFAVWDADAPNPEESVLSADISASTTTIPVQSRWESDTWAPEGGYVLSIHGERPVTVTAASTPVLSGGYYTQNLTVTRSPTLARSHKAGRPVNLSAPKRWGFGD